MKSVFEKTKELHQEIKNLGGSLIGVSKTFDESKIREAYSAGLSDFGENYLGEAIAKIKNLSDLNIYWHYLGRLQTGTLNKVIDQFDVIHTGAKISHLNKINERTKVAQNILVQIKHPTEVRDYGVDEESLDSFIDEALQMEKINLSGLMFIPPVDMLDEQIEKSFEWAERHFERIKDRLSSDQLKAWTVLSMGMSGDYRLALRNSASHVRLGRAIFGER